MVCPASDFKSASAPQGKIPKSCGFFGQDRAEEQCFERSSNSI
jgi:hypothetical protein